MDAKRLVQPSLTGAWLWRWIGLLLIAVLVVTGCPVGAREPEPEVVPIPAVDKLVVEEEVRKPAEFNPKLDSALNQLLEVQRREGMSGARAFGEARQMVLEGDRVQVILVSEATTIPGLAPAVEGLGGEIQGDYEGLLQALVPIGALEPLADRPDVQLIRDPWRAIELEVPEVGSATTEGVAASNAAAWHSAGYDGTGVRVAVINGGFTGYSSLLGSDLPSSVGTYDWTGGGMGGSEHGTACAEIVHDMAPGATMDLHKVSTVVDLNQAVTQAIADGVDVISMSLGWILDGPGDGTGYLASIVNTARAAGIFYATAAGNDAEVNWAGTYVNSGTSGYHAWDGGGTWYNLLGEGTSCVVFPAGYPIRGGLHWDDWSAVNQDYDLHLYRYPGGSTIYRVASSTNTQNGGGGQTPEEFIGYTAAGGNCYAWVVERVSSTRNVCLRMIAPKTSHFVHWTTGRSLTYPADSPDAITVAAVDVNSPYPLESYSSQGPTFGPGGACSGGATKPDIASYANVSTVSYGPGVFNGTSAATPHVAGAAALVKQLQPGYGVTQLQDYLETEAIDLGTPGKDTLYGAGRLYLPDPTSLVVTSITPDHGENTGVVSAVVSGSNFQTGASVKLTKSGQTDINGACGGVVNFSQITCDFDLTGVATGAWNVVVTNPDMESGTLPDGFTVTLPGGEDSYVYLPIVFRHWPPIPGAPTLYPISNSDGDGNYTVSWSTEPLATTYELQEDSSCAFSSPTVVYSGSGTSKYFSGKARGGYSYRVKAINSWGDSGWSTCQSVSVLPGPGTLPPLMDATVLDGYPTSNFGNTTDMWVGYDHCVPAGIARSLIKFDVSGIPAGTPISNAKLYLYLVNSCDIGERVHQVTTYRITSSWSSGSVTWNNQPGFDEAYGSSSVPSLTWGWYTFDVTGLLRKWVNGTVSNNGLMLRSNESSGNDSAQLGFATMNASGTSMDPYIQVTYPGMAASEEVILPAVDVPGPDACGATILDTLSGTMGALSSGIGEYAERTLCVSE